MQRIINGVKGMILTTTLNVAIDKTYLIDDFQVNGVYRTKKVTNLPGGKGINVTRILSALGEEVLATGFVGGFNGEFILQELKKQNLSYDFQKTKEESRICINILDSNNENSTEILESGATITKNELQSFIEKFDDLSRKAKVVVMSGSIPKGIPTNIYYQLVEIANNNGAYTILDASGRPFIEGIEAKPFMVKPNIEELEKGFNINFNTEKEMLDFIRRYINKGIKLFVVSMGGRGSIVGYKGDFYRVIPPKIQVVNPVGCGDALVAGFAIGLYHNTDMESTIKYATAIASSNALHFGAGIIEREEIDRLVKEVIVEKILT